MGIQALPQTTVRAIGANQALTDPAALVKELIDNALDARATSITVEIHANTLDVIQVKDNGHGIPPQDRPLVARRYCTSKISGVDDLRKIGGSSLGFRGEALASAAELSGGMTITTRVEGEQVAALLKINQQGEVAGQERASTPIGTTVRVTDFIKANPVRRQTMLKRAEQSLKKVKQVLQAYAFARPKVRLSLRVLKARNDKGNWTYAPKPGGNAEDAAFKVIGAACASQCTWSVLDTHGFTLQAFLPKADADVEKISSIGAFLSIDARPVSSQRGIPKQIIKMFREALKRMNARSEGVKEPFICLKIVCPDGSYDANIEPAKDNVLFENPDLVLDGVKKLFAAIYPGELSSHPDRSPARFREPAIDTETLPQIEDDFVTSLEQDGSQPTRAVQSSNGSLGMPQTQHDRNVREDVFRVALDDVVGGDENQQRDRQHFRSNMYGCDEDDLDYIDARPPTGRTEADFEELRQMRNHINLSNPWVFAKMHAKVGSVESAPALRGTASLSGVSQHAPVAPMAHVDAGDDGLPTPRSSSPSRPLNPSDHVQDVRIAHDGRLIGSASLPGGQIYTPALQSEPYAGNNIASSQSRPIARPEYEYLVTPALDPPQGTSLSAISQASARGRGSPGKRRADPGRPFVSPVIDESPRDRVWFEFDDRRKPRPDRSDGRQRAEGLVAQGELGDLVDDARPLTPPRRNRDIRDFVDTVDLSAPEDASSLIERRHYRPNSELRNLDEQSERQDENAMSNGHAVSVKGFVPASELAALEARIGRSEKQTVPAQPAKRRKTGERALRQISGNVPAFEHVPDDDAMHARPVTAAQSGPSRRTSTKTHRTKSSKLPLERTPAGKGTHDIATTRHLSLGAIAAQENMLDSSRCLLAWNARVSDSYDAFADEQNDAQLQSMAEMLRVLLINRVWDREMVQDLGNLVTGAFQSHWHKLAQESFDSSQQVQTKTGG